MNIASIASYRPRGVTPDDWDVSIAFVGPPGCGKSFLKADVVRALARTPAWVLSFDPAGSLRGPDVASHDSLESLQAGLAAPEKRRAIHVIDVADARRILSAAVTLGKTSRAAASGLPPEKFKHATKPARPVVIDIDEAVKFMGAEGRRLVPLISSSYLDPQVADAYMFRRHYLLAWVWGTQRPQIVHPSLWESCRVIVIFNLADEKAQAKLQENASIPAAVMDRVRALEVVPQNYQRPRVEGRHYIVYRR